MKLKERGKSTSVRALWLDMAKAIMLVPAVLEHTEASFICEWSDNMMLPVFWLAGGMMTRPDFSVRRKALRLVVPYLLMSILCLAFSLCQRPGEVGWWQLLGIAYGRFSLWNAPISEVNPVLMNVSNSVLWFLPSFFVSYLVFGLLVRVRGKWNNVMAVTACLALTWLMELLPLRLPWSLDTAPAFGAVIYCGRLLTLSGWLEKKAWMVALAGLGAYVVANELTGVTNVSLGDFGNSIWLWFPAAVCGSAGFIALCRLAGDSWLSRSIAWFNRGALFIFGMQLVFYTIAMYAILPLHIDWWVTRAVIGLAACFAGGKLLARPYTLYIDKNIMELWKR